MILDKMTQDNHTDVFLNSFDANSFINDKIVLDIGCGHGYAASQFLDRGAKTVHAMDIDLRRVNEISKPYYTQNTPIEFFNSWEELLSLNIKYDLIWHHHVIEHIEDCFGFLRQVREILSDDGEMWMACPNMASHSVFSPGHIHNFQSAQLVEVLQRTGFAIEKVSVWTLGGQLRVRVPASGSNEYPEVMKKSLDETGRCPAELLSHWNWK